MYKAFFLLVLVISVGSPGCDPNAASARREKESKTYGPAWEKPSSEPMAPLPLPKEGTKSSEKLRVEVEEIVELDKGRVEVNEDEPGYTLEGGEESFAPPTTRLGLRVKVVNDYETIRLLVRLDRFELETGSGTRISARSIPALEPRLPQVYIRGGQLVKGWLIFDVPRGEKKLTLISNLRIPPLRVPVLLGK